MPAETSPAGPTWWARQPALSTVGVLPPDLCPLYNFAEAYITQAHTAALWLQVRTDFCHLYNFAEACLTLPHTAPQRFQVREGDAEPFRVTLARIARLEREEGGLLLKYVQELNSVNL